jgi:hypothetical protein
MRTLLPFVTLLILVGGFGVFADAPPAKDAPPPAKKEAGPPSVAGPFHPYNVTGAHKGRFHCLISEHGLDPMVMIFHKDVDFSEPLSNLLKKLDTAIEKNPNVRLGSFVVFVPEEPADILGQDDKSDDARIKLEKIIADKGADLKLKHVVLCLDGKTDVEKYHLDPENLATVILYNKLQVAAVFALPKSELTDATVEKILAAVADKLGAKRK